MGGLGVARGLGALVVIAVFAGPVVLLVSGSLRPPGLPPRPTPELLPSAVSTDSYRRAVELADLVRATANSTLVAVLVVAGSVLVGSLAGFAISRLPARAARGLLGASLVALMVPPVVLLVPRFVIFRTFGVTDTFVPLLVPALLATSPLYVLVYYLAFARLPAELYDACRLADLSPLATWWRVAMPLARPVTVAVAALCFVASWSNLLDPLVYLYRRELATAPLALRSLVTLDPVNYPVFLAGAVLVTLPVVAAFALAQRFLLRDRAPRSSTSALKEFAWFGR